MPDVRGQLALELAALFSLVDSIVAPCALPSGPVAFTAPSEEFRNRILALGEKTKEYLKTFPPSNEVVGEEEEDFESVPEQLKGIKAAWMELHPYIRPVIQADTLHQPTSLVEALTNRFREIEGFSQTIFAIFHAETFDYLHLSPATIGEVADRLARLVAAGGKFPELGLIGIPSSQSSSLFLNCLIAHEMGHYVVQRKKFLTLILGEAEVALKTVTKTGHAQDDDKYVLAKWAEELFCDLFAIALVGPCYTFAYLEVYDLLQLLRLDGTLHTDRLKTSLSSFAFHPSHPFRVQQQALILRSSGWWRHVQSLHCRHARLLERLLEVPENEHIKANSPAKSKLVEAFLMIIPVVNRFLGEVAGKLTDATGEFEALNPTLLAYLQDGIVPSTLNVRVGKDVQRGRPSLVSLLNSGMIFCLDRTPELMKRIKGEDIDSVERRVFWNRKVEGWIAKGLEDVRLFGRLANGSADEGTH